MERAKEIFLKYNGNHFYMDRNGDGYEYASYHVPKETEEIWAKEIISFFLESKLYGKDALRSYAAVTELIKSDRQDSNWDKCLYVPLKSEELDDVTTLYMLPMSLKMAEKAVRKHTFSQKDANAYIEELESYIRKVQDRLVKDGLTRAADYSEQEFSDPAYVTYYLNNLKSEWVGLFQ